MLDRLSLLDALLQRETPATPLHTGGIGIFGDDLAFAGVAEVLRARIAGVPLARKRVQSAGLAGGRPVRVDDADFDLSFHQRHAARMQDRGDTDDAEALADAYDELHALLRGA